MRVIPFDIAQRRTRPRAVPGLAVAVYLLIAVAFAIAGAAVVHHERPDAAACK